MRALIISGGGCKSAFAGGVAEYLFLEARQQYDIFVGTSAGSLIIPFLALGEVQRLKELLTNLQQNDVFSINPFIIKENEGNWQVAINHFNTLRMFLRRRKTFGESGNLLKLIQKNFTRDNFEFLKRGEKKIVVTVSNLTRNLVEYKYLSDCTYEQYCYWIWASANLVPFMSLYIHEDQEYADGGFGSLVPIHEAIILGAKELDVIVLNPRVQDIEKPPSQNAFNVMLSSIDFMLDQIGNDDQIIGMLESRYTGLKIRFFHTPYNLTNNSFVFRPEQMRRWWQEGHQYARLKLDRH